jgi:hypothetical protein
MTDDENGLILFLVRRLSLVLPGLILIMLFFSVSNIPGLPLFLYKIVASIFILPPILIKLIYNYNPITYLTLHLLFELNPALKDESQYFSFQRASRPKKGEACESKRDKKE